MTMWSSRSACREVVSRIRAVLRRSAPRDGTGAERRSGSGRCELDVAARVAVSTASELELSRKEFDLLVELMRGGPGRHAREADVGGLGHQLVRLDEDAGCPHRVAATQARRPPGRPRWVETVRGVGFRFAARRSRGHEPSNRPGFWRSPMSSAGGVALGVPLGGRASATVSTPRSAPGSGPGRLAATAAIELSLRRAEGPGFSTSAGVAADSVRGRVIVVDVAAGARRLAPVAGRAQLRRRPEIGRPCAARAADHPLQPTLGADILATAVPVLEHGAHRGAVRVTQSVAAVHRAVRTSILDLAALGRCRPAARAGRRRVRGAADRATDPPARPRGRRVADGDLDTAVDVEGSTEQRSLARPFNEMTARIRRLLRVQQDSSPTPPSAAHAADRPAAAAEELASGYAETSRGGRAGGLDRGDRPTLPDRRGASRSSAVPASTSYPAGRSSWPMPPTERSSAGGIWRGSEILRWRRAAPAGPASSGARVPTSIARSIPWSRTRCVTRPAARP